MGKVFMLFTNGLRSNESRVVADTVSWGRLLVFVIVLGNRTSPCAVVGRSHLMPRSVKYLCYVGQTV